MAFDDIRKMSEELEELVGDDGGMAHDGYEDGHESDGYIDGDEDESGGYMDGKEDESDGYEDSDEDRFERYRDKDGGRFGRGSSGGENSGEYEDSEDYDGFGDYEDSEDYDGSGSYEDSGDYDDSGSHEDSEDYDGPGSYEDSGDYNDSEDYEGDGDYDDYADEPYRDSSKSRSRQVAKTKTGKRARKARKEARKAAGEQVITRSKAGTGLLRQAEGLWAAFCVPVVIMVVIFIQRGIFPFGQETFLRTDMYHQYAPFFSEFQHKLSQGGSLLYSWDIGMGVNFSALYAYYLASPLNWLLVLCPKAYVIEFMTYSIVLKIGLSGLSFAWYLKKHFSRQDFGVAFFGIFYALSGYMAAYSWNIMWLDCILLFPIVMLGLEKLVREGKGLLYAVSLGVCILSNYYISIMICLFMVIYFAALLILEHKGGKGPKQYLACLGRFTFFSLAAGGLAAVVLLPEIYALQVTASGDFNFPQTVSSYFSIFDMVARHMGNVEIEIGLDHWPNIYCGVAVLMFLPMYLFCDRISLRQKAVYCGMLLLFYASFSVNVLNFIWHGFHYPNSLPCRQSFIYICLVLTMCYHAYSFLDEMEWKYTALSFAGAAGFVLLAEKLVEQKHFSFYVYYIALIFLAVYMGLIYLYKRRRKNYNTVMFLALAVVAVEAAVNTSVTSVTTTSRTNYVRDNEDVRILTDSLPKGGDFYRIEKITRKTKNDGAWMNFPSVSLFSSTANADLTAFFKSVGCEGSVNAYSITGSTPLIDSLFSVKYALYSEEQWESDMLTLIGQSGDTYLYQRYCTLPLGFMLPDDFEYMWMRDLGNPALVQNNFCDIMGAEPVLEDVGGENSGDSFTFTPRVSGEYYAYIGNRQVEQVQVNRGEETLNFDNVNRGFFLELGWCDAGTPVDIYSKEDGVQLNAMVYLFDDQGLKSVYETLSENPFQVTKWEDSMIEGVVNTEKAGVLFTSIPYDPGWTVTVDGQAVQPVKMFDAFMGFSLTEGLHTINMVYVPQGLKPGICISAVSVACLLLTALAGWLAHRKKEMHQFIETGNRQETQEEHEENSSGQQA